MDCIVAPEQRLWLWSEEKRDFQIFATHIHLCTAGHI
jgi:hypothetical protein